MKLRNDSWFVVSRSMTLALAMTLLPACSASAGHRWSKADVPPGTEPARRSAFRPILSSLPTRTFYPAGYAGVTYPPIGQSDRAAVRAARRPTYSGRWFGGR